MIKKIKSSKVIIFAVIVCLVFSITAVSAFAIDDTYTGEYYFSSLLACDSFDAVPWDISFTSNGQMFTSMTIDGYDGVLYSLSYDSIIVYEDGIWSDDAYRSIYIYSIAASDSSYAAFLDFLTVNSSEPLTSYYDHIYCIIFETVFGGEELTSEQALAVSLLSTTLSLGVILVPFLVVGAFFIWILKRL